MKVSLSSLSETRFSPCWRNSEVSSPVQVCAGVCLFVSPGWSITVTVKLGTESLIRVCLVYLLTDQVFTDFNHSIGDFIL